MSTTHLLGRSGAHHPFRCNRADSAEELRRPRCGAPNRPRLWHGRRMVRQRRRRSTLRRTPHPRVARLAREQRGSSPRPAPRARWGETTIDRRIEEELLTLVWPATYAFGTRTVDAARAGCSRPRSPAARIAAWSHARREPPRAAAAIVVDDRRAARRPAGVSLDGIRAHRMRPARRRSSTLPRPSGHDAARTALDLAADRAGGPRREAPRRGAARRPVRPRRDACELARARAGRAGVRVLARRGRRARRARAYDPLACRAAGPGPSSRAGLPVPRVNAWFPTRGGHGARARPLVPDAVVEPRDRRSASPAARATMRSTRSGTPTCGRFGVHVLRVPDTARYRAAPDRLPAPVIREELEAEIQIRPSRWGSSGSRREAR